MPDPAPGLMPDPAPALSGTGSFKLPINYVTEKTYALAPHVVTDLELVATASTNSLYEHVFAPGPNDLFAQQTLGLWAQQYSASVPFIHDSQAVLQALPLAPSPLTPDLQATIHSIWQEIRDETGFIEKYHYVDHQWFTKYNNSAGFLQCLSIYNMTSPVMSLAMPLLFLIMPFLILKIQRMPISCEKYCEILKTLFKRHQLGQLFNASGASYEKLVYMVVSLAFYVLQIYNNIMTCRSFYTNLRTIHQQLFAVREFAQITVLRVADFSKICAYRATYAPFIAAAQVHARVLQQLVTDFAQVTPYALNFEKLRQVGYVMKCFYQLNKDPECHAALLYAFGFHGYLDNLGQLRRLLVEKRVAVAQVDEAQVNEAQVNEAQVDETQVDETQVDENKEAPCPCLEKKKKCKACRKSEARHKSDALARHKSDALARRKSKAQSTTSFVGAYFPAVGPHAVKNTYSLNKQLLITGPNAAGKTTLLKTTLFNLLLTQQTGVGFYESARVYPYDIIHCYINIPDTSARDSLFQAEARRCKDILTQVVAMPQLRHFCIFDELYSGTNPYEAISSAYAFLRYLTKHRNTTFLLTTHFLELCNRLKDEPAMRNCCMDIQEVARTDSVDADFVYTYLLRPGISTIKGGVKVLRDLEYPEEIVAATRQLIKELHV